MGSVTFYKSLSQELCKYNFWTQYFNITIKLRQLNRQLDSKLEKPNFSEFQRRKNQEDGKSAISSRNTKTK
ncbi:MAG: hypothetical protein Tsb0014_23420 [Pleurocapsa sp.]